MDGFLDRVVGSRAKIRILRELCRTPQRSMSGNALARQVGMSPNTVHRALKDLEAAGLVDLRPGPVSYDVSLQDEGPLVRPLMELFTRESGLRDEAVEALRRAMPDDVACLVFGSFARGTAGPGSDVDLLVVADTHDRAAQVSLLARDAVRAVLPFPVRAVHLIPSEARAESRGEWFRSALSDGIPVTKRRVEDVL